MVILPAAAMLPAHHPAASPAVPVAPALARWQAGDRGGAAAALARVFAGAARRGRSAGLDVLLLATTLLCAEAGAPPRGRQGLSCLVILSRGRSAGDVLASYCWRRAHAGVATGVQELAWTHHRVLESRCHDLLDTYRDRLGSAGGAPDGAREGVETTESWWGRLGPDERVGLALALEARLEPAVRARLVGGEPRAGSGETTGGWSGLPRPEALRSAAETALDRVEAWLAAGTARRREPDPNPGGRETVAPAAVPAGGVRPDPGERRAAERPGFRPRGP